MFSRSVLLYVVVGLGGYAVYLVLLAGQVEWLGVDPVIASVTSFIVVLLASYWLSHQWVFRSRRNHRSAFVRYVIVTGIGLLLNITIMYVTIHLMDWWYMYSQVLVFTAVALNNYLLNHYWTFSRVADND